MIKMDLSNQEDLNTLVNILDKFHQDNKVKIIRLNSDNLKHLYII